MKYVKMKYVKMKYVKMKYVKMKYVKMKYVKMKYVKNYQYDSSIIPSLNIIISGLLLRLTSGGGIRGAGTSGADAVFFPQVFFSFGQLA